MIYYYPQPSRASRLCDTRDFYGNAAGCRLYLNERDSDVSISVEWDGISWRFPAHRLVLSTMSDVFRTMFDTDMLEKTNRQIIIRDCSALTVKQFLKYLYMGALEFSSWMEAADLLKMAHKYGVVTLITLLESQLVVAITFSNVCQLHDLAQTYSLMNLKKTTGNLILDAAFVISATEGFLHLSSKSLEFFLSSPRLNVENECCILTTLKEWATIECIRRGLSLTRSNILNVMEPFMKHINWSLIPEELRTFVPEDVVQRNSSTTVSVRKAFHVPASLQYHINILKFMIHLGAYSTSDSSMFNCARFVVDNHVFIAGFKILGLFRQNSIRSMGFSSLGVRKDNSSIITQFNLNSLPWTRGTIVGEYIWQELTAYLPYPVRIDPFSTYVLSLKTGFINNKKSVKWPVTRLEITTVNSALGPVNFSCLSECCAITQLFVLPAPPPRNVCNILNAWL